MKAEFYRGQVIDDIDGVTRRMYQAAAVVPDDMIQRATRSVLDRARMCVDKEGQHIEQYRQ